MGIKDKISSVLLPTPPPPMPISGAVSGVPQATSGTPVLVPEVTNSHPFYAAMLCTPDLPHVCWLMVWDEQQLRPG